MASNPRLVWVASIVLSSCLIGRATAQSQHQVPLAIENPWGSGHNELYIPDHHSPIPGNIPFVLNERINYYEKHINDLDGGDVRRSPCPAVNVLANRGYIPRSGRDVRYEELSQAARDVYNFGDDNILLALIPTQALHSNHTHLDLDMLGDDLVQHQTNCPAAPTRNDRELGDNINLNITLLESLLSFSKDGETLTMEDMAEHHHLRHNQSLADNPQFRFGNQDASCTLAQYANLVAVLGRVGKHGLHTVFVEDVRQFYVREDLPAGYGRRQMPYYSIESMAYIDRMSHHIGFQIAQPFPENDQDGRDVEPVTANFDL